MIVFEKWKITLITIVVLASAILASPNIISGDGNKAPFGLSQINLGLDLQGGSYLLLKVELDDVIEERLSNSIEAIRSEMRSSKIGVKTLIQTRPACLLTSAMKTIAQKRWKSSIKLLKMI